MFELFSGIDPWVAVSLVLALAFVLAFEFINGFHDTANAVATVIYTKAMPAHTAVVMSGLFNFAGALLGGVGVAYAIVHLLPVELLLNVGTSNGLIMVFSLLASAIIWNLGTWYFGIPASSSHTLIGSLLGVGVANAVVSDIPLATGVNWGKAFDIMLSLVLSPTVGFVLAAVVLLILSRAFKGSKMHMTPEQRKVVDGKKHPPFWNRLVLVTSAMGMSFVHGSNDGQKGVGLIMLVLIGIVPAKFAVDLNASAYDIDRTRAAAVAMERFYTSKQALLSPNIKLGFGASLDTQSDLSKCASAQTMPMLADLRVQLDGVSDYQNMSTAKRTELRRELLCLGNSAKKISKLDVLSKDEKRDLEKLRKDLVLTTEYAPTWVIFAVALALGLGTTFGWKRIVHTVGEKIGASGMTYAQGMSAQIVAFASIGMATFFALPVSTTHVVSSGVAGTMVANRSGLQHGTVKTILLAWVLTLPITIGLSAGLFILASKLFN